MDQMGEVEYAPGEPKGTPWHPHRGFETVTYMLDGIFEHQDSNGGGGVITNGDTQWMTAGAGILHIEKPPEHLVASGGCSTGSSSGSICPRPRSGPLRATRISGGARSRCSRRPTRARSSVIAGDLAGETGPGQTYTPMTMVHASVSPGSRLNLPWRPEFNALAYVLSGAGSVGNDRRPIATGQLAVFGAGDVVRLDAAASQDSRTPALEVLVLGGRPIREPVAWYGPFVMNTRDELTQAFEDYQAGRLGTVPAIHHTPDHVVESMPEGDEPEG